MRVHIDGKLIKLKSGKEEKYPMFGNHGLYPTLDGTEDVLFTEGFRDVATALEAGFNATGSSGGASTWRDSWLPAFKGKKVVITMDADIAGERAAIRAAESIVPVAKQVEIVNLPYKIKESHGSDLYDFLTGKK